MRKVKSADKLHGSHRPELILVSVASRSFKYGYFPSLDDGAETSNQIKVKNITSNHWDLKVKKTKTDQVAIGISFKSYWLTGWHKFSKPIKWRGKAKPKVFRVISGPWKLFYEEINISDCSSIFQTTILDKFLLLTRENFQFDPRPAKLVSATTFPCSTLEYLKWKLRNVKIIQ